jgi:hypothetical protein
MSCCWTSTVSLVPALPRARFTRDDNPFLKGLTAACLPCREKLRFPSGTATANVIRTLFGIPQDEPPEAVAAMRTANDPANQVLALSAPGCRSSCGIVSSMRQQGCWSHAERSASRP